MTHIWVPGETSEDAFNKQEYGDAKHERHPHGIILVNGKEVASTLMCPHCGTHFISRKGSGIRRAWCPRHMAVTCGDLQCDPCTDFLETLG